MGDTNDRGYFEHKKGKYNLLHTSNHNYEHQHHINAAKSEIIDQNTLLNLLTSYLNPSFKLIVYFKRIIQP